MNFKFRLINQLENEKYIYDYSFADILLRVFSIAWIGHVIYSYKQNLERPLELFEPIIWIQSYLSPNLPSQPLFYCIASNAILLCIHTIFNKKIIFRVFLFLLLIWLNALKWNYNFFSHVGHLFLLAHLFTLFIPPTTIKELNSTLKIKQFSYSIRWAYAGVLITYSMAGFWKYLALFSKLVLYPTEINWLSERAAKLNAIVSARLWDETVSNFMLNFYNVPWFWQIGTLVIFTAQLFAILGAFNKRISYFILIMLVLFHFYNLLFINTHFYAAVVVLLILLFPYHLLDYKNYRQIKL
ncbi:MAG: hypothetical protein HKP59_08300 [Lutibacter sp.]|uniref:hypothetical protein n=1 Tax=Lutibacter sp. TaxID=1925666 RepID=UPI00183641A4|nr:hypothetical protein [Lutibacter sp.]MBT8317614.1 hypothetical protein [Lutibacter sp.]NNJ58473.1 hypothetical protein [Lutibacter sp.]